MCTLSGIYNIHINVECPSGFAASDCLFVRCVHTVNGGAFYISNDITLSIVECAFVQCHADNIGGAIFIQRTYTKSLSSICHCICGSQCSAPYAMFASFDNCDEIELVSANSCFGKAEPMIFATITNAKHLNSTHNEATLYASALRVSSYQESCAMGYCTLVKNSATEHVFQLRWIRVAITMQFINLVQNYAPDLFGCYDCDVPSAMNYIFCVRNHYHRSICSFELTDVSLTFYESVFEAKRDAANVIYDSGCRFGIDTTFSMALFVSEACPVVITDAQHVPFAGGITYIVIRFGFFLFSIQH